MLHRENSDHIILQIKEKKQLPILESMVQADQQMQESYRN